MEFCRVRMLTAIAVLLFCTQANAQNWLQFRGPDGAGKSKSTPPVIWSDSRNLKWAVELPGRGVSSPIVVDEKIFITAYSGVGQNAQQRDEASRLVRSLVCFDRKSGELKWQRMLKSNAAEDGYEGFLTDHGYASSTPVSDGQRVFAFFGKSGVYAFDLNGKPLWQRNVGSESGPTNWGSAASPIVYKNLVIVNACDESQALVALDAQTGAEVWRAEASRYEGSYSTPLLAKSTDGRTELVVPLADEIWSFDPNTGKLNWWVEMSLGKYITSSPVSADGVVYVAASSKVVAIRLGGTGDVTQCHVLWDRNAGPGIPSPIYDEGKLYWVATSGIFTCADAATGKTQWRKRFAKSGKNTTYASLLKTGNYWIVTTQVNGSFVFQVTPEFTLLSSNTMEGDATPFKASAAVSRGELFLRSDRYLYSIAEGGTADLSKLAKTKRDQKSSDSYSLLINPGKMFQGGRSPNSVGPAQLLLTFDVNNDNRISREELAESPMPKFAQTMMFLRGDMNGDNFIDPSERQALQGDVKLDPSETVGRKKSADRPIRPAMNKPATSGIPDKQRVSTRVMKIFADYDADNDGKLTSKVIPFAFRIIFSRADGNGDGFVTPTEMQAAVGNAGK